MESRDLLFDAFDKSGLEGVEKEAYASNHTFEGRRQGTLAELGVVAGIGKQQVEDGVASAMPLDDLNAMVEKAYAEIDTGAYIIFFMLIAVGRKPK